MSAALDLLDLPQGVQLESYTDKRSGERFICYRGEASRDWWSADRRPYDSDLDPPLTEKTVRGNARRLLPAVEQPGEVYCSPACGFKCKKTAYDRAVLEAGQLCETLGPGWQPNVWENFGWCWSASKGSATVHPSKNGSNIDGSYTVIGYTAYLNFEKQVVESAPTALEALNRAAAKMCEVVRNLQNQLAGLEE